MTTASSSCRCPQVARAFALALLMPRKAFKVAHHDSGGDVAVLAERFDVPPDAAHELCQILQLPTR